MSDRLHIKILDPIAEPIRIAKEYRIHEIGVYLSHDLPQQFKLLESRLGEVVNETILTSRQSILKKIDMFHDMFQEIGRIERLLNAARSLDRSGLIEFEIPVNNWNLVFSKWLSENIPTRLEGIMNEVHQELEALDFSLETKSIKGLFDKIKSFIDDILNKIKSVRLSLEDRVA